MKVWRLVAVCVVLAIGACSKASPRSKPMPGDENFQGPVLVASGELFGLRPAGDRGQCAVHHAVFEDDEVPIVYGFPYMAPLGMGEARESRFPNAADLAFGGCSLADPALPHAAAVAFCPQCRAEERAWELESAAAGQPWGYDFAMRERMRSRIAPFPHVRR
jgi:hypothetical protein